MTRNRVCLVPVDFSRGGDRAFGYALNWAHEKKAKLIALHVVPAEIVYPPIGGRFDFYATLEREAREKFAKLAKRKKLKPGDCALMVERGTDFADVIVSAAKKLRVELIIMGSHGRTGLHRFLLGSVAERTLRYADCPVLIVK